MLRLKYSDIYEANLIELENPFKVLIKLKLSKANKENKLNCITNNISLYIHSIYINI